MPSPNTELVKFRLFASSVETIIETIIELTFATAGIIMLLMTIGCQPAAESRQSNPPTPRWSNDISSHVNHDDSSWEKRWWIDKVARVLRGGVGIGPDDNVADLLTMSDDDIISKFMDDDRFGDSILDFNMYFLGFKNDSLKQGTTYRNQSFTTGQAVDAAQAVLSGGDFFKIYEFFGPVYIPALLPVNKDPDDPPDLDPKQVRRKRIADFQAGLQSIIDYAQTQPTPAPLDICNRLQIHNREMVNINRIGVQNVMINRFFRSEPNWYLAAQVACQKNPVASTGDLIPILKNIYNRNDVFFNQFLSFEVPSYNPKKVADFKPLDLNAIGITKPWIEFDDNAVRILPNSSTNFDRKRSAYILKYFFCDDLTPVGVIADPSQHAGGPHASDVSCKACHYKLDPMAGFFRDFGSIFRDYSMANNIYFDDGAHLDRVTYESAWAAPSGSTRQWNVGYIRSEINESENSYGLSLDDLSALARTAPEARRCVVKRLFEYFVSQQQTVDAGYLDYLTTQFTQDAAENSAQAVKNTIRRLLESGSFATSNPDPNQCYDYAPGENPQGRPPCRVAYLLEKNCQSCHGSTSDRGNLDLKDWMNVNGTMTFPHLDDGGHQVSALVTMQDIVDRLSSTDPDERMPKKKDMSTQDRQELYLWAQKIVSGLSAGNGGSQ